MASGSHGAALRQIHRVFDEGTLIGLSEGQLLERFVNQLDEAAFETILARYGPMVLGVCRRFLHQSHDIEDAFQATFLILIRKAGSLKDRELLGHWLYGVAYRVALRARAHAIQRRSRDVAGVENLRVIADPCRETDWHDLSPVLDAEVNRLPERFRAPVILCLIEDRTHEEAARALGWPVGTVKSRLARGRERLRARLTRLGLAPSAALLGFALAPDPVRAAVPPALAHTTLQAARRIAAGRAVIGAASTMSAATLTRGVLRSLALVKLEMAALFVLAVAVAVIGAVGLVHDTPGSEPAMARPELAAIPPSKTSPPGTQRRTLDLRVVAARTKQPVAGASVFVDFRATDRAITDAQGRCRIALEDIPPRQEGTISVWKDGLAPLSIHFTHDDVIGDTFTSYTAELDPAGVMGGTVQDEQGHPIAGAKITIWLRQSSNRNERDVVDIGVSDPITTDAKGRWRLGMLPLTFKDSDILGFKLSHPDFVSDAAGPERPTPALKDLRNQTAVLVMAKGVPVSGTVLDTDGKPVKDAQVSLALTHTDRYERYTAKTNEAGRFAFQTRPGAQAICFQADRFAPALEEIVAVPEMKPTTIRLQPGLVIKGRVVDSEGQSVERCRVRVAKWRNREVLDWEAKTDVHGRFRWENAPADMLTLIVYSGGGLSKSISVAAAANPEEVVIVAKTLLKLRGVVVDAATGQPVPRVRVIPGLAGMTATVPRPRFPDGRERPQWEYEDARTFDGGRFEIDFKPYEYVHAPEQVVRIEAEGHAPAISRAYQVDDGRQTWDVRLEPRPSVSGVVHLPEGPPAAGADVILVTPTEGATFHNGRLDRSHSHADRRRTGPDGRFWFARPDGPYMVAVLAEHGFAFRSAAEMAASRDLVLQPWGRIEGTLLIGTRAGADEEILGSFHFAKPGGAHVTFQYEAKANDQGRFVLDRVLPGGLTLSRSLGTLWGMPYNKSHLGYLEVQPGETLSVKVGATGRPLVGRLVLPPDTGPLVGFGSGWCLMIRDRPPPYPRELLTGGGARIFAWLGEFRQTEAGRAYFRQERIYAAVVAEDGTFRIENVEPGSYKLDFTVPHIQIGGHGSVWGRRFGKFKRDLVVPEVPRERGDEPLDLGRVELTLNNEHKPEVGDIASPFTIKTLDGKPLRLLAYRGKYVLLDFWTTWSGAWVDEMPHLKSVYKEFAADPRLVMIGLSLDEDAASAREYAAANGLKWIQGHLPFGTVPADYGVTTIPKIVLIGPDGKVVALDLGGDRIRQAVSKALERKPVK